MSKQQVLCSHCGAIVLKEQKQINRALKIGALLFCGKACFGLSRRTKEEKTLEQKKIEKAAYDREYRRLNAESRKKQKADYYQKTKNPEKERIARKARMHKHVEYCRNPEYKEWKKQYDQELRGKAYADFKECYRLLLDLEREIRSRTTKYERLVARGYFTRNAQQRRRNLCQLKTQMNSTLPT